MPFLGIPIFQSGAWNLVAAELFTIKEPYFDRSASANPVFVPPGYYPALPNSDFHNDLWISKHILNYLEGVTLGSDIYQDNFNVSPSVIKIRDPDGEILYDEVYATDVCPLIGATPFNYYPHYIQDPSPLIIPQIIYQISFLDAIKSVMVCYGPDLFLSHISNNYGYEVKGILQSEPRIAKKLGEEIFGSIVFPETTLVVDNSDHFFDFLITNPKKGYNSVIRAWVWNPDNSVITDEYSGEITSFQFSDTTISFTCSPIGSTFFDRNMPLQSTDDFSTSGLEGDTRPIGRHFGFNVNTRCPLIYWVENGEAASDEFRYFVNKGRCGVTSVRGRGIAITHASAPNGLGEWDAIYDAESNLTYLKFNQKQDNETQLDAITCDFESWRTPYKNLVRKSIEFTDNTVWDRQVSSYTAADGKLITNYSIAIGDRMGPSPDGRRDGSFLKKMAASSQFMETDITLSSTSSNGLFAYALFKTVSATEGLKYVNSNSVPYGWDAPFVSGGPTDLSSGPHIKVHIGLASSGLGTYYNDTVQGYEYLGGGWYLFYAKKEGSLGAGSYKVGIELTGLALWGIWLWGVYCARGEGTVTTDLLRHPIEVNSYQDGTIFSSTRNYAMNLYELLTNGEYGFGELSVDQESFELVGMQQFKMHLYCDGGMHEFKNGKLLFDDLLMPLNCRLEREGVFRTWYLKSDITPAGQTPVEFGYGDDRGLGNILQLPSVTSKPSYQYPKKISVEAVPIRDEGGDIYGYRRRRTIREANVAYGQERIFTNSYVYYEITADVLSTHLYNKLANTLYEVYFTTDEKTAWSLQLDDTVKLWSPNQGIDGIIFEIIAIDKGVSTCGITCRPNSPYTYTYPSLLNHKKAYPQLQDRDRVYPYEMIPGSSGGVTGVLLPESGVPDSGTPTGSLPSDGFMTIFGRKTFGSSTGQEVVVKFADGSQEVLARSAAGAPVKMTFAPISESIPISKTNPIGYVTDNCQGHLSKPALYSVESKPRFFYRGQEQELVEISHTGIGPIETDEHGAISFIPGFSSFKAHPEYENGSIVAIYATPTDYSGLLQISSSGFRSGSWKPNGKLFRWFEYVGHPSVVRVRTIEENLIPVPYTYVLDKEPYETVDFIQYYNVIKYDQWGKVVTKFTLPMYSSEVWDQSPPTNSQPRPHSTTASFSPYYGRFYGMGMDVDQFGEPWIAFTDSMAKSWLVHLTADGGRVLYDITGFVGGTKVCSLGFDTKYKEFHICCASSDGNTKVYLYHLDEDNPSYIGYQGLQYTILHAVHNYSYSPSLEKFYATLYATHFDLTSYPYGGAIVSGSPNTAIAQSDLKYFSTANFRIKDVVSPGDGYAYFLYQDSSNDLLNVYRVREDKLVIIQALEGHGENLFESLELPVGYPMVSDETPSYLSILSARSMNYTHTF